MKARATGLFLFKVTLSILGLGYVFHRWIDTHAMLAALRSVSPALVGIAFALALSVRWLLAEQFRQLAAHFRLPYTTSGVMKAHLISSFFATIAPGEVISSGVSWHYLAREHRAYAKVAGILVFLKLIGYTCLAGFALVALFIEPRLREFGLHHLAIALAIGCSVALLALLHPRAGPLILAGCRRIVAILPSHRLRAVIARGLEAFLSVHPLPWSSYAQAIGYAILANVTGAIVLGCLFTAAGVNAPWSSWFWLRAVLTVLQLAPISIGGTGVREITFVYLLQKLYGVPPETAIAGSFLVLGLNLFYGIGIGSLLFILDRRKAQRSPSVPPGGPFHFSSPDPTGPDRKPKP